MLWSTSDRWESMRTAALMISPVRGSTKEGPIDEPASVRWTHWITW